MSALQSISNVSILLPVVPTSESSSIADLPHPDFLAATEAGIDTMATPQRHSLRVHFVVVNVVSQVTELIEERRTRWSASVLEVRYGMIWSILGKLKLVARAHGIEEGWRGMSDRVPEGHLYLRDRSGIRRLQCHCQLYLGADHFPTCCQDRFRVQTAL